MALLKLAGVWEKFILKDLTTFAKYAKVELVPPGPGDLVGAVQGVGKLTGDALTFKWAQASMKDVAVNTVVVTEVACWFFIGECIEKGTLIGYQV
jgi:F-type H+-transporting ATPase subunit g